MTPHEIYRDISKGFSLPEFDISRKSLIKQKAQSIQRKYIYMTYTTYIYELIYLSLKISDKKSAISFLNNQSHL